MTTRLPTSLGEVTCSVCGTAFAPRLAFQRDEAAGEVRWYCSLPCRAAPPERPRCTVCAGEVVLRYAFQVVERPSGRAYLCSEACLTTFKEASRAPAAPVKEQHRVAVLNQKGGTGKTTTAISLAAGLAEAGRRVLLVDADPQGNVAVSLGLRPSRTLYHVLVEKVPIESALVPIGENFDVLGADETLAKAEWMLAQNPGKGGLFAERFQDAAEYDHVVIDCGPALSLVNQHALCYARELLIPVACEYLPLVGVKQLLATVKRVNRQLGHPLEVGGVLPTFYDQRMGACQEALAALRQHFGDKCLSPIRANVRLKEAPQHKKTIFEYDPASHGAEDYRALVGWMLRRMGVEAPVPIRETPKLVRAPAPIVFGE